MTSDNRDKDSEDHPKNKWYEHRPTKLTIAISGVVLYLLFVFVDVHEIWPSWPLFAVIAGIVASIAAIYLEAFAIEAISFPTFLMSSGGVRFAGVLIYFLVPRVTEPPIVGWLQPANDPAPPNGCDGISDAQRPKNRPLVILGTFGVYPAKSGSYTPMHIGSCAPITIEQGPLGVAISADIFSPAGHAVGHIRKDNGYEITGTQGLVVEKDLHTVVVHDAERNEVLYMRYVNPQAIHLRGIFSCPTQTIPDGALVIANAPSLTFPGHNTVGTGCDVAGRGNLLSVY